MKIRVKVKTGGKEENVEKIGEGEFKVFVKERPEKGKANEAVLRAMANRFGVSQSRVKILRGFAGKEKTLEIL